MIAKGLETSQFGILRLYIKFRQRRGSIYQLDIIKTEI